MKNKLLFWFFLVSQRERGNEEERQREEEERKTHQKMKKTKKKKKTLNSQLQSSAYLVFFMHCGFAMLSVGCVRARFSKHICILILLDACASAIGFFLVS